MNCSCYLQSEEKNTRNIFKEELISYAGITCNESDEDDDYPHYVIQEHALMDEDSMHTWIIQVLVPHARKASQAIAPILLLDMNNCHMMCSVINRIPEMSIQVIHNKRNCKGMCEQLDIRVDKPFKNCHRVCLINNC